VLARSTLRILDWSTAHGEDDPPLS
jgi:hypothetical protein